MFPALGHVISFNNSVMYSAVDNSLASADNANVVNLRRSILRFLSCGMASEHVVKNTVCLTKHAVVKDDLNI